MADNDFKLTTLDRLVLSNQYRILEALYPDEAETLAIKREAIENGYENSLRIGYGLYLR